MPILNLSAAATLLFLKNFTPEPPIRQTALAGPRMVELFVIPTAKCIPVLAAPAMAGVETRPPIAEAAASPVAPPLLLQPIPRHLVLTAVAVLPLVEQLVTPMVLMVDAAQRMGTAGRRLITVVLDA